MEILVLGFPRTGTQSIAEALVDLGCTKVYHMREVGKNQHQQQWIAALEAKFDGKGAPYGRASFDAFLHDFDAVSDFPAAIFAEELIQAYPDAMVILSVRDEDTWYKSMMSTLWHAYANHPPGGGNPAMRTLAEQYHKNMWANDFPVHGRLAYQKHNDLVRELGKGSRFLEYNVKESWGPLCRFLEKPVPDQPFPMKDDWLNYKAKHDNQ